MRNKNTIFYLNNIKKIIIILILWLNKYLKKFVKNTWKENKILLLEKNIKKKKKKNLIKMGKKSEKIKVKKGEF